MRTQPQLASVSVGNERPIFYPDLGRFFVGLRERHGWSQSDAARYAEQRGIDLTRQVLLRLEKGATKNPEPDVLRAVAQLYGEDYHRVVSEFLAVRYGWGTDLTDHDRARESTLPHGGGDRDTATRERLQYLEGRLLFYEELIEHAKADAARTLATLSPESSQSPQPESGRRRRARRVR